MHAIHTRLSNVFFYSVTTLGVLAIASWVVMLPRERTPVVELLDVQKVYRFEQGRSPFFRNLIERVDFSFDLKADLSDLFDWNVKQIFVFVTASYQTDSGNATVVVWDDLLYSKEEAVLNLEDVLIEYPLLDTDKKRQLPERVIRLGIGWDVMPLAGGIMLTRHPKAGAKFRLPESSCDPERGIPCKFRRIRAKKEPETTPTNL